MIEISESGKTLDARGLFCPSPVMQTNVELSKMKVGEILTVLADAPAAGFGCMDAIDADKYLAEQK